MNLHSLSSPCVPAGFTAIHADDILIEETPNSVPGDGPTGRADQDSEKTADKSAWTGTDQMADDRARLGTSRCSHIAPGSGPQKGRRTSNRRNDIGFGTALRTIHAITSTTPISDCRARRVE